MLELLIEFLIEKAWIVVAALWVIGRFIKETPNVPDWLIPYLLLPLGITGTVSLMGFHADAVLQGVIVTGVAVYGHVLLKQAQERD